MFETRTSPLALRRQAERLAAPYPTLLAEAERVAAIVAQGVHGRRRAGQGETFWQYRNYQSSDSAHHIDWRRSARSDQVYVRENEWEAANTVYIWRDGTSGMDWQSQNLLPTKQDRASVLAIACATLLMRAGERCAVLGESERPRSGRLGLERIARRLALSSGARQNLQTEIPAHARLIILSDFLEGAEVWRDRLARLSGRPAKGVLVQMIDPAERDFPYKGRVQMRLPGRSALEPFTLGRAERAQAGYRRKFQTHCEMMAQTSRRLGWPLITHETDAPATLALTALYMSLNAPVDGR